MGGICGGDPGQKTEPKPPNAFSETTELAQSSGDEPRATKTTIQPPSLVDGRCEATVILYSRQLKPLGAYLVLLILVDLDQLE